MVIPAITQEREEEVEINRANRNEARYLGNEVQKTIKRTRGETYEKQSNHPS